MLFAILVTEQLLLLILFGLQNPNWIPLPLGQVALVLTLLKLAIALTILVSPLIRELPVTVLVLQPQSWLIVIHVLLINPLLCVLKSLIMTDEK